MADARLRGHERAGYAGDTYAAARALNAKVRSRPWDAIPLGCVTCRGSGMHNAFDGDERKCPTCRGSGDAPGMPARLRLAAFAGHGPSRIILPRGRMPGKSGIEDHDVKTGFKLLSYTFGIIPVYAGLLKMAEERLTHEGKQPTARLGSRATVLAREIVGKCKEWVKDPRSYLNIRQALAPSHWYAGLVWAVMDQQVLPEQHGVWANLARLQTLPAAAPRQDRIAKVMIQAYPKITEPLHDWESWKAFKLELIKWALGDDR